MAAEEKERGLPWRLNSAAANDLKWYYREAAAACGFRAARLEMSAPTIFIIEPRKRIDPSKKVCRRCMTICDNEVDRCPKCKRRRFLVVYQPAGQTIHVHSSAPAPNKSVTERPDNIYAAVAKIRRIEEGLSKLPHEALNIFERVYNGRQHTPEIRRELGDYADFIMRLPRCQRAYSKYVEEWRASKDPLKGSLKDIVTWLTFKCIKSRDDSLKKMREDGESIIAGWIARYARARVRDQKEVSEPKQRRRSVLESVRGEIILERKRAAQ
jgi:hypothetical protein